MTILFDVRQAAAHRPDGRSHAKSVGAGAEPIIEVVLVDEDDAPIGTADKISAHQPPAPLHRAVSLVLFDDTGRMLLQQRSQAKYHFRGLWANSCCGHPLPGESVLDAAQRRCRAELGVTPVNLRAITTVTYQAHDIDSGLMEHELDHVLVGNLPETPHPDPDEVAALAWISLGDLCTDLERAPASFAPWLPHVLNAVGHEFARHHHAVYPRSPTVA